MVMVSISIYSLGSHNLLPVTPPLSAGLSYPFFESIQFKIIIMLEQKFHNIMLL